MQADFVWRRRTRSVYRSSEGYRCPAASHCVDGYLKPLSLGLSLTPADRKRGSSNQVRQQAKS
jgi:hypothetical protein